MKRALAIADRTNKYRVVHHRQGTTSLLQNELRFHDSLGQSERAKSLCSSPSTDRPPVPGATPVSAHERAEERYGLVRDASCTSHTSQTPSSNLKCFARHRCFSSGDGHVHRPFVAPCQIWHRCGVYGVYGVGGVGGWEGGRVGGWEGASRTSPLLDDARSPAGHSLARSLARSLPGWLAHASPRT